MSKNIFAHSGEAGVLSLLATKATEKILEAARMIFETKSPKGEMGKRFGEMKSSKGETEKMFDEMKPETAESAGMLGVFRARTINLIIRYLC